MRKGRLLMWVAAGAAALTAAGAVLYNMYGNTPANTNKVLQIKEGQQQGKKENVPNFAPALEKVKQEIIQGPEQVVVKQPLYASRAMLRKQAPAFSCKALQSNGEFSTISLQDFKGKYVVLFFYPLDFTFVCPTEICAFSDAAAEFRANNSEIIGCSIDSEFTHLAWTNTSRKQGGLGKMDIPLLADVTQAIAKDYGVLIEEEGTTLRGTFIIDHNGILRHAQINDHSVGRNVSETLRLVQAFQHADKYGEVCPSNWKQGDKTMKPNPKDAASYFSTTY